MSKKEHSKSEHDAEGIGNLLWKVSLRWQLHSKQTLDPFGITQTQYLFLLHTKHLMQNHTMITQQMLAEAAELDKMMTSKVLKTLEEKQLIVRTAHQKDARSKTLELTAAAEDLLVTVLPLLQKSDKIFFEPIFEKQIKLKKLLNKIYKHSSSKE